MSAVAAAEAAKVEGQERSSRRLTDADRVLFRALVAEFRPGETFSINDVRRQLDDAGVPNVARASLFSQAAAEGLIEQMRFRHQGATYPMKVPSTGTSAHRADVVVWARLQPPPDGAL